MNLYLFFRRDSSPTDMDSEGHLMVPFLKMEYEAMRVQHLDSHKVEMAGIEPASERIDPRTSTSVVGLGCR